MTAYKLFTFVFTVFISVIKTSADISLAKTLQSHDPYKNTEIYFDKESQQNGTLLYMLCHRSSQIMSCTIFREEHYVDKLPRISPCNVTLQVEDPYVGIGETVRVLLLNPSKALILWVGIGAPNSGFRGFGEANILKFTIVDFDSCASIDKNLKTTTNPSYVNVSVALALMDGETMIRSTSFAFYDNVWDISFRDLLCGTGFCKLRINKNTGQVISQADFWYSEGPGTLDIVPKNPKYPDEGNLFIDSKSGVIRIKNENQCLENLLTNRFDHMDWQNFRYSVRKDIITVCKEIEETKVMCDQIYYDGNHVMHVSYDLKKNLAPVPHTLRGGEFLFLTTECVLNCTERATYHVYKVNPDFKLTKLMDIENFECKVNEFTYWHTFFENEKGSICVSLLCYNSRKKYPKGILVWDSPTTLVPIDVYSNTPEELHIQCLKMPSS